MQNSDKFEIKEKCGVIGVWNSNGHAPSYARRGLAALQHRGQESAGLSILTEQGNIQTYKGMGFVLQVLTDDVMRQIGNSRFTIGHNRYSTSGESVGDNAQPFELKNGNYQISIGHNGNIPDIVNITNDGEKFTSDTPVIAKELLKNRPEFADWEETMTHVLPTFKGAYCLVILTEDGLYAVRDPLGIRPLSLGKIKNGWMIASESVSFDVVGGEFVRDIAPGEIVKIDNEGQIKSCFFGNVMHQKFDIFEFIYFSRPDSFLNGRRVRTGREKSGRLLGERIKKKNIKPDVVVPTFESGYPAAKGVAQALGLPIVDAITTSNYIGRTFIQPGQENRENAVNGKHNIIADEVAGKKVIVVDDSAVRLTTSRMLAKAFRNAGVDKIYFAFASPPVVDQCDMGIDMRSKDQLPAAKFQNQPLAVIEKEMAVHAGADEIVYQPIEDTAEAMDGKPEDFYYFPFGGPHPLRDKQKPLPQMKKKINGKPKICIFISGMGTNLQNIIDQIKSGNLDAEICNVLSNKPDVYGVERAKNEKIPTTVIPYTGKINDKAARNAYDQKLIEYIKKVNPDLIVLAGWMLVLGEKFLRKMQEMEIPVINLHSALLTKIPCTTVQTSYGRIPVLRGINTIQEAFEKKLPVSGATVHQILPGEEYDTGPIIMKAEVRRNSEDTFEIWDKKIRTTEYMILPAALKRVLHVMKEGVDVSKGEYSW